MAMEYRFAARDDIETLMRVRLETLRSVNRMGAEASFDGEILAASRKYFLEGDHSTVLAMDGDRAVGCATMCYVDLMPTCSHPTGKRAHLMNVYTAPDRRRQGIASRMVSMLMEEAWRRGVTEISLDATEAGRPLYRSLGFRDSAECMVVERPLGAV